MAEEVIQGTNLDKLIQFIVIWTILMGVEMEDGRKFLKLMETRYHSMILHFMIYIVLHNILQV